MKKNITEIITPKNLINNLKNSFTDNDIYSNKENNSLSNNFELSETSQAHLFCSNIMEINSQNEYGYTPVYLSILSNNIIALNELLSLGANPNIPNNLGETPLYLSVDKENYDSLIILLQYNIDVNHAKKNGNTALHLATQKKLYNFILALLRNGATPNIQNKLYGQTAMHLAVINQINEDLLTLFHEYKGDIYNIKDKYDKTAFDYAKEKNDEYYIHLLIKIFGIDNFSCNNKNNFCYKDLMTWKESKLSNNIKDIQIKKYNVENNDNDSLNNDNKGPNNSYKNSNMNMGKMCNMIMNMKNDNNFNETNNFQFNNSKDKMNYDYVVMESNNESKINDINSSKTDIVQIVDNTKSFIKDKNLTSSDEKSDNIIVRDISNLNINFNSNTSKNNTIKSDKIDKISLSEFLPVNTISIKDNNNDENKENNINNSNNNDLSNNLYVVTNPEGYYINNNTHNSANSKICNNNEVYKITSNNSNNSCSDIYKTDSENVDNYNININTYKNNKTISIKNSNNSNNSISSSKQGKEIIKNIINDTVKKVVINTISSSYNEVSSNNNLVSFKESYLNNSISKKNSFDKNNDEDIKESKISDDKKESKSNIYSNVTTSFMMYKTNNQFTNTNNNNTVNVENIFNDELNTNKLITQNNNENNISYINAPNNKDLSKENNVFVTTTNSNIFSELQMNTNNNFSLSYSRNLQTDEDINNQTKVNEDNKIENNMKENNNKNKINLDLKESEINTNNNCIDSININTINSNQSGSINSANKNKNGTICKISKNVIKKNLKNNMHTLMDKIVANDNKNNLNNFDMLKSRSFIEEKVSDQIKDNFGMNIFNKDNQNIQKNKNKKNNQIHQGHHRQLSYHINFKSCLNKDKKDNNEKNNNKKNIYHNKNNIANWCNSNSINIKKSISNSNNNISTSTINNNKIVITKNSSMKNLKIASIDSSTNNLNKNNFCHIDSSITSTAKNIRNTNSNASKSRHSSANTCVNSNDQKINKKNIFNQKKYIKSNKIKKKKNFSQDNINNNDCNKRNTVEHNNNNISQYSKIYKKSMSSKNNLKNIENSRKNNKPRHNSRITTITSNMQSNHCLNSNISTNNMNISRNNKNYSNLNIENEEHYNDYNYDAEFNLYDESDNYKLKEISTTILIRLREWLISCDLLCYYNLLIKKGIYDIDSYINDYQEGIISLKYKDLEKIGFKKPGHIFRFLLKLEIDSGIIDNDIFNYIIEKMNYNSLTTTIALTSSINEVNFCGIPLCNNGGCCGRKKTKNGDGIFYNDLNGFLKNRDLLKFKANFIHNGFDRIEYILIQLFSKYEFNKQILNDCFHVYSESDKLNLLNKLFSEKKMICDDCDISFDSNELNKLIESKTKLNKCKKSNGIHQRENSNCSNFEFSQNRKKNDKVNNDNNNMCVVF